MIANAILGLGFSLAGAALLGMYIGSALDRGSSSGTYTPLGLIFGLLVGFHRAWIIIQRVIRKTK